MKTSALERSSAWHAQHRCNPCEAHNDDEDVDEGYVQLCCICETHDDEEDVDEEDGILFMDAIAATAAPIEDIGLVMRDECVRSSGGRT